MVGWMDGLMVIQKHQQIDRIAPRFLRTIDRKIDGVDGLVVHSACIKDVQLLYIAYDLAVLSFLFFV